MAKIDKRRAIPDYIRELLPKKVSKITKWPKLIAEIEKADMYVLKVKTGYRTCGSTSEAMNFILKYELNVAVQEEILAYEKLLNSIRQYNG